MLSVAAHMYLDVQREQVHPPTLLLAAVLNSLARSPSPTSAVLNSLLPQHTLSQNLPRWTPEVSM